MKNKTKIIPLCLGVITLSLFLAYLLNAAWTEPTLPPPQGQVEIRATAMATTTGTPVPTDCDEPAERGSVRIDPATDRQYICGNLGWTFLAAAPALVTLTVTTTGEGTVGSSPAGISCPADCTEPYAHGTSVALTATPAPVGFFGGWGGACSGTGDCVVSMTAARDVQASFQVDQDGDGHLAGSATECNDNCATCFVGSNHYTLSADGLDQNCDGITDNRNRTDTGQRTNFVSVSHPRVGGLPVSDSQRFLFCRECVKNNIAATNHPHHATSTVMHKYKYSSKCTLELYTTRQLLQKP